MMKRERDKDEEAETTMITEQVGQSLCCPGPEETDELTASLLFSPPSIVTSITPPSTTPIPIHNNRVIHSEHHREEQQQQLDETEEHLLLDHADVDENDQHSKSHLVAITGAIDDSLKNSYNSGSSSISSGGGSGGGGGGSTTIREQDLYLPVANISRVMKSCLPENAKIAKDAKEVMQEYLTEFILFLASEASDLCMYDKRKTMNGDDLLEAMEKLGFEEYVPLLTEYLASYRENQKKLEKQKASTVSSVTATKK